MEADNLKDDIDNSISTNKSMHKNHYADPSYNPTIEHERFNSNDLNRNKILAEMETILGDKSNSKRIIEKEFDVRNSIKSTNSLKYEDSSNDKLLVDYFKIPTIRKLLIKQGLLDKNNQWVDNATFQKNQKQLDRFQKKYELEQLDAQRKLDRQIDVAVRKYCELTELKRDATIKLDESAFTINLKQKYPLLSTNVINIYTKIPNAFMKAEHLALARLYKQAGRASSPEYENIKKKLIAARKVTKNDDENEWNAVQSHPRIKQLSKPRPKTADPIKPPSVAKIRSINPPDVLSQLFDVARNEYKSKQFEASQRHLTEILLALDNKKKPNTSKSSRPISAFMPNGFRKNSYNIHIQDEISNSIKPIKNIKPHIEFYSSKSPSVVKSRKAPFVPNGKSKITFNEFSRASSASSKKFRKEKEPTDDKFEAKVRDTPKVKNSKSILNHTKTKSENIPKLNSQDLQKSKNSHRPQTASSSKNSKDLKDLKDLEFINFENDFKIDTMRVDSFEAEFESILPSESKYENADGNDKNETHSQDDAEYNSFEPDDKVETGNSLGIIEDVFPTDIFKGDDKITDLGNSMNRNPTLSTSEVILPENTDIKDSESDKSHSARESTETIKKKPTNSISISSFKEKESQP